MIPTSEPAAPITEVRFGAFVASLEDVSLELATDAHRWTSFSSERRGEQRREEYLHHLADLVRRLTPLASTPEKAAALEAELKRHQEGYLKRLNAYLSSHGRVASPMITGPANFPTRRNEKRQASADKRRAELLEYAEWSEKRICKTLRLLDPPVDRLEELTRQLEACEARQQALLERNRIFRSKTYSPEEKAERLSALDLPERERHVGYSFELTNNGANIRRLKLEVQKEEAKRAYAATTPLSEYTLGGVRVLENAEEDRLQLFFEGKPDETTRSSLKRNAFKWSPRNGCWQRQLTNNARHAARQVLGSG